MLRDNSTGFHTPFVPITQRKGMVIKMEIIKERLKEIICDLSNNEVENGDINDNTILTKDLGFDSIRIISLIVEIESRFGIEIEDSDLDIEKLTVFNKLTSMIKNKLE